MIHQLKFFKHRFRARSIILLVLLSLVLFYSLSRIKAYIPKLTTNLRTTNPPREQEYFLAYLPHSGLSNQRIELANALLLAYMLNRTLLIPPAFLGSVFSWMPRESLADHIAWLTTPKPFTHQCEKPTPAKLQSYVRKSRCDEYRNLGILSWTDLHDLSPLTPDIQFRFQDIFSLERIQQDLNLSNPDVHLMSDTQLYDWRLYESSKRAADIRREKANHMDSFAGRRYYKVLEPHNFSNRKERLLFLGGVFGSTRINVIDPDLKRIKKKIHEALYYRLDKSLGQTVKGIIDYLGGPQEYMALHFRTGDGPFKKDLGINLKRFIKGMTDVVGECADTKIYLATDHKNPRSSELWPWFEKFPCTTTLNDIPTELLSPLDDLKDRVSPSKPLKKFMIPLVDAMVAAHAKEVLTTPRSTFSKYVEELHEAWSH